MSYLQEMRRIARYIGVVFVVGLFLALPLFRLEFIPTHDGEYHIIRFSEFYSMMQAGYWFPRWAPNLNSSYGIPLFNFHYPFPNYIGALFHYFGWSFVDSFKLTMASGYLVAVVSCFLWLRKLFGNFASVLGAVVFATVPYWFVDIYVRGSVGEVFALMWIMVVLVSVEYGWSLGMAISSAGVIVSHNILAMIFFPFLILYTFVRCRSQIWMIFMGVGLASYFWIPALLERSFVVGLNMVNFKDHFPDLMQLLIPSWGTGFSGPGFLFDEMSQQIGIIPLVIIGIAIIILAREKRMALRFMWLFVGLFIFSFFLMLPQSIGIWYFLTPLQYIQYPWRLLSIVPPTAAVCMGYLDLKLKRPWVSMLIAMVAMVISFSYSRPVYYVPRTDQYYLSKPEFTQGTSSLGNIFSTRWSPWKQQGPPGRVEILSGDATIGVLYATPLSYAFQMEARSETTVRVNLLYYPGWIVEVDQKKQPIEYEKDGTIQFKASSGVHSVRVYFNETPLRLTADVISILCLFWIVRSAILEYAYAYRHRHKSTQK